MVPNLYGILKAMDKNKHQADSRPRKSEMAQQLEKKLSQECDIERMFSEVLDTCARRIGPATFFTSENQTLRGWRAFVDGDLRDISDWQIPSQDGVLSKKIAKLHPFTVSPDADADVIAEMRVLHGENPVQDWRRELFGESACAEILYLPWSLGRTLGGVFVFSGEHEIDGALMIEMAEAVSVLADNVIKLYAAEHTPAPETPVSPDTLLANVTDHLQPSALFKKLIENERGNAIGVGDLHRLIASDPETKARVVKLASGPYYCSGITVEAVDEAFVLLEPRILSGALLAAQVREMFLGGRRPSEDRFAAQMWRHALACGAIARVLAKRSAVQHAEYAFAAGLLHDIGRMIFHRTRPVEFSRWLSGGSLMGGSVIAAEIDIFGCAHTAIGARWARENDIPEPIVLSIAEHHASELHQPGAPLSAIVDVANVLCRYHGVGLVCRPDLDPGQNLAWQRIGLSDEVLFEFEQELPKILAAEPLCF